MKLQVKTCFIILIALFLGNNNILAMQKQQEAFDQIADRTSIVRNQEKPLHKKNIEPKKEIKHISLLHCKDCEEKSDLIKFKEKKISSLKKEKMILRDEKRNRRLNNLNLKIDVQTAWINYLEHLIKQHNIPMESSHIVAQQSELQKQIEELKKELEELQENKNELYQAWQNENKNNKQLSQNLQKEKKKLQIFQRQCIQLVSEKQNVENELKYSQDILKEKNDLKNKENKLISQAQSYLETRSKNPNTPSKWETYVTDIQKLDKNDVRRQLLKNNAWEIKNIKDRDAIIAENKAKNWFSVGLTAITCTALPIITETILKWKNYMSDSFFTSTAGFSALGLSTLFGGLGVYQAWNYQKEADLHHAEAKHFAKCSHDLD